MKAWLLILPQSGSTLGTTESALCQTARTPKVRVSECLSKPCECHEISGNSPLATRVQRPACQPPSNQGANGQTTFEEVCQSFLSHLPASGSCCEPRATLGCRVKDVGWSTSEVIFVVSPVSRRGSETRGRETIRTACLEQRRSVIRRIEAQPSYAQRAAGVASAKTGRLPCGAVKLGNHTGKERCSAVSAGSRLPYGLGGSFVAATSWIIWIRQPAKTSTMPRETCPQLAEACGFLHRMNLYSY